MDEVAELVAALGQGTLMAKVDIESAYRLVPVHSQDRPLLGIRLNDCYFCDGMLPFGLRSAPKIFTAVADALEWCICKQGVHHVSHHRYYRLRNRDWKRVHICTLARPIIVERLSIKIDRAHKKSTRLPEIAVFLA